MPRLIFSAAVTTLPNLTRHDAVSASRAVASADADGWHGGNDARRGRGLPAFLQMVYQPQDPVGKTGGVSFTAGAFARVRCDDLYFRATGGGVTFGGGEPLLHAAFLAEFRALCPDWRLTVETSLNVAPELLAQCEKAVDEFIVDIKDWDETVYYAYTGHSGAQARENLRHLLMDCPAKIHVRVPLIPQFNTPEQQSATAAALGALGAENIELFSYVLRE